MRVLASLVEALVDEELVTVLEPPGPDEAPRWTTCRGEGGAFDAVLRWSPTGLRCVGPVRDSQDACVEPAALLRRVVPGEGAGSLVHALDVAVETIAWLRGVAGPCERAVHDQPGFLDWERLTALRGRPFHPAAQATAGWSHLGRERYRPEARRPVPLPWVAVPRDEVRSPHSGSPTDELGTRGERRAVTDALRAAGLDDTHIPLPAHPWQLRHGLGDAGGPSRVVPLDVAWEGWWPTSSIRTLTRGGGQHLKLPVGVATLGATRTLPPRYCLNAAAHQRLLEELPGRGLPVGMWVCDERSWWSWDPREEPLTGRGALGCVVRRLPPGLDGDEPTLVALGAFGHVAGDGSLPALSLIGRSSGAVGALRSLTRLLTTLGLTCWSAGLVPELHGQNVLVVVRNGQPDGVLLRDHDAVRTFAPWLRQAGLQEPVRRVSPHSPNTLEAGTPEELLAWFQTLCLRVGVGAVVDAVAATTGHAETDLWAAVAEGCEAGIADATMGARARRLARSCLLVADHWPTKQVLRPWLDRGSHGTSMPSRMGRGPNPLRAAGHAT